MGRYITGDINRKLWFAIQPSNAADRFGVIGTQPNFLEYYFDEENLEEVEKEIESIRKSLGKWEAKLDKFFENIDSYNSKIVEDYGLDVLKFRKYLPDYADLKLGLEIKDCIKQNYQCSFEAEC